MLASLFACAVAAQQPQSLDLTKPITYEANGLPARQVLGDIGRLAGVHLEAINETQFCRYIVHLEKAPLKDVLNQLAYVSFGTWEQADGGYRLRRDNVQIAQNQKEARANEIAEIGKMFVRFRKNLAKQQAFSPEAAKNVAQSLNKINKGVNSNSIDGNTWQRMNDLQQQMPMGRAMDRVLLSLSPELLADIPPRTRVILSNAPTAQEYALPDGAMSAINNLIDEQAIWAEAAQKYTTTNENQIDFGFGQTTKKNFRNATRVLLCLTRYSRANGVNAELFVADAKGSVLGQSNSFLNGYGDEAVEQPKPATPEVKKLPAIPLSPLAKTASTIFGWDAGKKPSVIPGSPLYNAIQHPSKFDPLSLVYGEGLLAMAKEHHENLLVLGDDAMVQLTGIYVQNGTFNQDILRQSKLNYVPETIKVEDGWYTSRPKDALEYDSNQLNREQLESLLAGLIDNGQIKIEPLADFALANGGDTASQILSNYANVLVSGAGQIIQQNDWDSLRFYGALDDDQRHRAGDQRFASLSPAQLDLAHRLVFGLYSRLNIEMDAVPTEGFDQDFNFWNKITREAPEALPNGIPSNSTFDLNQDNGDVVLSEMQYGDFYQGIQIQEPEGLAWMVYMSQKGNSDGGNWKILSLQGASRRQITVNFKFAPKISQAMTLMECKPTGKRSPDMKDLPDGLRDRLAKQVAEIAKNYQNSQITVVNGGGSSGGNGQPR